MNSIDKAWVENHMDSDGEVIIPDGIEKIDPEAFKDNELVRKVVMPDSIIEIGDNAFSGCSNLEDIRFSNNLKTIGEGSFLDCKKITHVELPKSIETIKEEAFACCEGLESLLIDEQAKIVELQTTVFCECRNLSEVVLPKTIKTIGKYTFAECEKLSDNIFTYLSELNTIKEGAFMQCQSLSNIDIPSSVQVIEDTAFMNCSNLRNVNFNDRSEMKMIGGQVFEKCEMLETMQLPDGIEEIGRYAYAGCTNLTDITLGENIKVLGEFAFWKCERLKGITLPDSLKKIKNFTFYNCVSLSTIDGGENIEELGVSAFANCESIKQFKIPPKVKNIAIPFENCSQLEELDYGEGVEVLDAVGLEGVKNLRRVVLNKNLKYAPESTFYNCDKIEEVEINGTDRIEYGLLKGKSSIKKLLIDNYEVSLDDNEELFTAQKSKNKVTVVIRDKNGKFKTKCINLEKRTEKEIGDNLYLTDDGNLCFARNNLSECSLDFLNILKKQGQTHLYICGATRFTIPNEYKNKINYDLYTIDDLIEIKTKINKIKQNIIIPQPNDPNRQKKIYSQIVRNLSTIMEYDAFEVHNDETHKEEDKESIKIAFEKATNKKWEDYFEENKDRNVITAHLEAGNLLGLLSGKAVCRGNSEIIRNIAAEFGIEVSVILGAKHAWNQVQLDGQWYDDDFTQYQGYLARGKLATSSQRFLCGKGNGKSEFSSIDLYKKVCTRTHEVGEILSRDEKKTLLSYGREKNQSRQQSERQVEAMWQKRFQSWDRDTAVLPDGAKKKTEAVQVIQNLQRQQDKEKKNQEQIEN